MHNGTNPVYASSEPVSPVVKSQQGAVDKHDLSLHLGFCFLLSDVTSIHCLPAQRVHKSKRSWHGKWELSDVVVSHAP